MFEYYLAESSHSDETALTMSIQNRDYSLFFPFIVVDFLELTFQRCFYFAMVINYFAAIF